MKMFKKTLSVTLAALTVLVCLSVSALAADVTVKLRIEGIDKCLFYGNVTVDAGATVLDVIKAADETDPNLTATIIDSDYGPYLAAVNGIVAGAYTEKKWDGWSYTVDGVSPDVGMSAFVIENGDSILMYYGDPWNTGMQYPTLKTDKLSEGKVYVTSMDTVYDEKWNASVAECAVTGYTLYWDGIKITPDENGVCTLNEKMIEAGTHSVQIEKYDLKTGLPTVLRFAPDFTVTVEKTQEQEKSFFDIIKDFINMIIDFIKSLFKF